MAGAFIGYMAFQLPALEYRFIALLQEALPKKSEDRDQDSPDP